MKRLLAAVAVLAVVTTGGVAYGASKTKSRKDSGTAYVAVIHQVGSQQIVAGDVKDKILGDGALVYHVAVSSAPPMGGVPAVTVTVKKATLFTEDGSISGTASAVQTINADGTGNVTNGKFKFTKGTGALKGHSLTGTFSGPFDGSFYTFTYKGTYK